MLFELIFEFIGTFARDGFGSVLDKYLIGNRAVKQIAVIAVSLLVGIIFFAILGILLLLFPSPNFPQNKWYILSLASLLISLFFYLTTNIGIWLQKRKEKDEK